MTESQPADVVSILLVDDQPGNLLSLKAVLDRPEYDLVLAHDGEEALTNVLEREFAVILLDVMMPGMDGFEVASIIKQRESFQTIPIIFITASVQHIDWIFKAYSVGAVDFLHKPLDPLQVRAKVSVFVALFRQKRQIQVQAEQLREQERLAQTLELDRQRFQHERRFRNLAEAIPHVVWTAAADGNIDYMSRRWREVTGSSEQAAKAAGWFDAVHPEDAQPLRRQWDESIRAGQPFSFEFRLRTASGLLRWQNGRALPERANGDPVVRWLGTFTDVDEQMRAHEELRAAVRMRDEFISLASHELRTPLTGLQLRVQSLHRVAQGTPDVERMEAGLNQTRRQVERLTELVDRLLDSSNLARGHLELKLEEFDLTALAHDVTRAMAEQADRAGCALRLRLEPDTIRGTWDRLRLGQVLTNLLSNAIKYGAGKPVEIVVTADEQMARIAVTDHGIGLSPDQIERIFGRFERAAPVTHFAGLGLGLYVVAQVVEAHSGRVKVDSRPGEGATFIIELPRATANDCTPGVVGRGESTRQAG